MEAEEIKDVFELGAQACYETLDTNTGGISDQKKYEKLKQNAVALYHNQQSKASESKRLYEWLMDENREKAQTFFTAGDLRNVAKEIEFRVQEINPNKEKR